MDIFDLFEDLLSDDDEDLNNIINIIENPRRPRIFRPRITNMDRWRDKEFIQRFRISKRSVETILPQIEGRLQRNTEQNHALIPLTQLLVTLRFYACGSMLVVVGDFGGIDTATACRVVRNVSQAIASLSRIYIKMPTTNEELQNTKNQFLNIANFPNVIGAIDCTHIRIQSPGGPNAEHFRNRKGYFSINTQTVADANLKITNIVARWPGASNDRTIFNNCRLKAELDNNVYGNSFILGDSGYTLSEHVMIPLNNPVTQAENLYNESQIRTRNVVERKYGIWKRRFQVLRLEMRVKLDTVLTIIVATAVLHNIALQLNDPEPDDDIEDENNEPPLDPPQPPQGNGLLVRQNLIDNYFGNLIE